MAHPQVPCRHCRRPIAPDGRGYWSHLDDGYPCRDEANVLLSTYAEPPQSQGIPLNPVDYRASRG